MGMKDLYHRLQIENKVRPTSCANAAAFNTAHTTTSIDMVGCEAVTFLLVNGDQNQTPDYVFELFDSDVSATDAGAICAAADVMVHAHGLTPGLTTEVAAEAKIAAGVLTETANGDEDNCYSFTYIGPKRWVRLQCPTGTKTETFAMVVLKWALNREPVKA